MASLQIKTGQITQDDINAAEATFDVLGAACAHCSRYGSTCLVCALRMRSIEIWTRLDIAAEL